MAKQVKIPVVKNRIAPRRSKRKTQVFRKIGAIAVTLIVMILFVWLKIQTNLMLAGIQNLEAERNRYRAENEKLQAEVVELSSFARIHRIARERLNLDFLAHEKVIEVPVQ